MGRYKLLLVIQVERQTYFVTKDARETNATPVVAFYDHTPCTTGIL